MSFPPSRAQAPVDPARNDSDARFIARVRSLMVLSGFATALGIAVVLGVIGYRVLKSDGSAPPDVIALLPRGAKVVSTTVAGDRIAVVVDVGGSPEVRTFDLRTLRPAGRLKFATEP